MHAAHDVCSAFFNNVGFCKEEQQQRLLCIADAYGFVGLIKNQYFGVERQYLTRVSAVANGTLVGYLCTEELRTSVTQNNTSDVLLCSNSSQLAIPTITYS